ncbi:hypothetical protein [Amycolatopsis sp. NPDC057786]|uniref:hypothetical protein n=1 Tax=Amycolatopsis sp. NPDC057786 TaxID=3346250 RepID=UPI0036722D24
MLRERRIKGTIPERADQIAPPESEGQGRWQTPRAFDPNLYKLPNVVEQCFNRLK